MQKPSPTLEVIKIAHQAHLKWWRGQPLLPEEHDAMLACQGFDVLGIVLSALEQAMVPPAPVSGAV